MARRRYDLPFAVDGSGRFLPWMIALMVYLAALAAVAALATHDAVTQWNAGLEGTATVEVAPAADAATTEQRVAAAIELLRATRGIASAAALPVEEVDKLLEPWLGPNAGRGDLPVPRLIDVRLEPDAHLDMSALAQVIAARVPGARLDNHGLWLGRLKTFGDSVQVAAALVVVLIAIAAGATVVFATRSGLAVHRELIELMHLIGSRDSYIARQFQSHAMSLALRGGALGVALGALTVGLLAILSRPIQGALLPDLRLGPAAIAALAALPLGAAFIAMITARVTVLRALRQMI